MKKLLMVLFCFSQTICAGVQISENTATRLSFTWTMDGFSILDSAGKPAIVAFKNQNVELGDSGQPVIPAFSFLVGVPPQGKAVVRFTPVSTRAYSLRNAIRPWKTNQRIIRQKGLHFTDAWVSDARPYTFGPLHANQFILKPFIYDEKNRTLQVLQKAQCTIEFPAFQQKGSKASFASRSDFQKMLSKLVLNYNVAGQWAISAPGMPKQKVAGEFPLAPSKPMVTFTIGDGHDGINEGTINENGIMKISGGDLLKLLGSPLQISQLACYGSRKGELPVPTPGIANLPDGVTEIPLMRFDLNNNGLVDSEDYVLLYVTGASDWAFDTAGRQYYYNLDRFEDYRHYWLFVKQTGSPLALQRMPAVNGAASAALTSFENHILFKKSLSLSINGGDPTKGEEGGLDWIWQTLTPSMPNFQYQVTLPLIDTAGPASMKIVSGPGGFFDGIPVYASFSNIPVCTTCQLSAWNSFKYGGDQTVRINISGGSSMELAQLEFKYRTRLDMSTASALTIFSPESGSVARYTLSSLPKDLVYIFRITPSETIQLVDTIQGQAVSSYSWTDSAGKGIKYYVCSQSGFQPTPGFSVQAALQSSGVYMHDLRAVNNPASNRADYLIITHSDFITQAVRLANHKQSIGRFAEPKVIDIMDVYREFSGGAVDPAALRNFLVYAKTQWGLHPDYVVLLGKGHYNYKGIKTSEPVYIPVAEFSSQCIEDYFAYLDTGDIFSSGSPTPDIFVGRLPCISLQQASQMVDKIVDFEDPKSADFGAWRDRLVLVNDDDMQGTAIDALHDQHLISSEAVGALVTSLRPSIDLQKVNEFEYPWNEIQQKPEARAALINQINNGAAFVNYFGHGSNIQWADERIMDPDALANLHNHKNYPMISSFSCSVGHFDRPDQRCLSEDMVLAAGSGASATISATREAFADANGNLANAFYANMFDSTQIGTTFGEAYTEAKVTVFDANAQNYSLLGDPSLRPVNCVRSVVMDIINKSGALIDTLKALQAITVRGSVRTGVAVDATFGSTNKPALIQLSIFNPPYMTTRKDGGADQSITYQMPGTPVFAGQTAVINGTFQQTVHLPKTVTFNKAGASVIAFACQGPDNGLGQKGIVFSGTDTTGSSDTAGPTIAIRQLFDQTGSAILNQTTVNALSAGRLQATLPFSCEIDVFDPSGINVVGTGPDEGIAIEIPGVLSKQNINQKFSFLNGDYRKGAATMEFTEGMLNSGTYTMTVSAQDLSGNVTRKNFVLDVTRDQTLSMSQVFNYPNPMKMGSATTFYFNLSKTAGITCTIKLYTLSGKLIRVFYGAYSGEVFDGRDQMGNLLGPKVYLYQVIAEDNSQAQPVIVKSGIQKLAVHPPR